MTDHPQTATERFLRHGVAGGFNGHTSYRDKMTSDDWEAQVGVIARELVKDIHALLLNPVLWEAAGRSLGFGRLSCEHCGADAVPVRKDKREAEYYHDCCPKKKLNYRKSWQRHWHGLLDHLAAHPGDVDGYLAGLLDDDPLPHQEPCNCRDCSLTDTKDSK